MDEAVPGNSTNSPFELLQAPNAIVIEATEASKQRYRGLTAGPLMNAISTSTLALRTSTSQASHTSIAKAQGGPCFIDLSTVTRSAPAPPRPCMCSGTIGYSRQKV